MRRGEVRDRLLEAALRLCATDGVGATTIRGVIRECGANLNAIHYHFGSWPKLVSELVTAAMQGLNDERFERLDALTDLTSDDVPASALAVLEAGYAPLFRRAAGPDWQSTRAGLVIVQQLRFDPSGLGLDVLDHHSAEFVRRIEARLGAFLPHRPAELRAGMQAFNAAAWDIALRPDTLERTRSAQSPERALKRITAPLFRFGVGGLLAMSKGMAK
ncbi:MAG: TetR family transcriptional regulator [Planctomycetota bacterium]